MGFFKHFRLKKRMDITVKQKKTSINLHITKTVEPGGSINIKHLFYKLSGEN